MKDLILITSYCETEEKIDILRNLVNQINKESDFFDLMIVSHLSIPEDIIKKSNYFFYDYKNELLTDFELLNSPFFKTHVEAKPIVSSLLGGQFNTHLTIWRMIITGNKIAESFGYDKIHHIEYDASIVDFSDIKNNSELLETYDCVTYKYKESVTSKGIMLGCAQSYKLSTLDRFMIDLDETGIKSMIRKAEVKSPELFLEHFLHKNKNGFWKNHTDLEKNGNILNLSAQHKGNILHWCVPFYEESDGRLKFIVWNNEKSDYEPHVKLIYNESVVIDFGIAKKNIWNIRGIDDYHNAKSLMVFLDGELYKTFDFEKYGKLYKIYSKR